MANKFWVQGTGSWSDATNHWSLTSGGSPGAGNLPTSSDDVFIDANSGFGGGGTLTITGVTRDCHDFTCTSGHSFVLGGGVINNYGSITLESGITKTGVLTFDLHSNDVGETITTAGVTLTQFIFDGTGSYTLTDATHITGTFDIEANCNITLNADLTTDGEFYTLSGTFDANDHNVNANDFYFYANTGYTPTVIMGSGTWEATGYNFTWYIDEYSGEVVTIIPETSTIKLSNATANHKYFTGGSKTYNNLWITGAGALDIIIFGSNTFNDFKVDNAPQTIKFEELKTHTINTFTVSGTVGNLITLDSEGIAQHTLSKSSGAVSCDYLNISNSNAIGGASWYAGANSIKGSNVSGWIFNLPTGKTLASMGVG